MKSCLMHTVSMSADELIPMVFPDSDVKKQRYNIPQDWYIRQHKVLLFINPLCLYSDPNDCVLKVTGQNSYIHGYQELKQFCYVVKCVTKKEDIELVMVRKLNHDIDKPRDVEDVSVMQ